MLYFDHAATTSVKPQVLDAMKPWLSYNWGNPSSHYSIGYDAQKAIENSRISIAASIGAEPDEIFFTSCGSEANTWAIKGIRKSILNFGRPLVSTIEHHSIIHAADSEGSDYIPVDMFGRIHPNIIKDKIKEYTNIVSTMWVNNEIGTIAPIESIAPICEERGLFYHVDAVQALGHLKINLRDPSLHGITSLSISGHKIGAPKGIGALYIRKDVQNKYIPLIYGGQQEHGLRGGTENVAFIVGFGKACELIDLDNSDTWSLAHYALHFLRDNISNAHLNGLSFMDEWRVPNILNVSFDGINGEELVTLLDEQGICISTGSACNSYSNTPSHVLKAMGISDEQANSSIRISFGYDASLVAVNELCQCIVEDVEMLRG